MRRRLGGLKNNTLGRFTLNYKTCRARALSRDACCPGEGVYFYEGLSGSSWFLKRLLIFAAILILVGNFGPGFVVSAKLTRRDPESEKLLAAGFAEREPDLQFEDLRIRQPVAQANAFSFRSTGRLLFIYQLTSGQAKRPV